MWVMAVFFRFLHSRHGYYGKPILGDEKKAFILYSAYAWGMPILLLLFTLMVDQVPREVYPDWFILPNFGLGRCWYSGKLNKIHELIFEIFFLDKAKLYYFFVPIGLLVFCNIVFYGITAFNLLKHRRQTTMLRKNRRGNKSDRQR